MFVVTMPRSVAFFVQVQPVFSGVLIHGHIAARITSDVSHVLKYLSEGRNHCIMKREDFIVSTTRVNLLTIRIRKY